MQVATSHTPQRERVLRIVSLTNISDWDTFPDRLPHLDIMGLMDQLYRRDHSPYTGSLAECGYALACASNSTIRTVCIDSLL